MSGPGYELKAMLALVGLRPTADCPCQSRADLMDRQGPLWCRRNLQLIVDWLEEEADRRRLPFNRRLGGMLVRRAIRRSERSLAYDP